MPLEWETYETQKAVWPRTGRHILAHYDDETIVVYQAYCPAIGPFAAANGYFGNGWSESRMSWIKPNFLWMMFRCGWATKENQETVLALTLRRADWETILAQAVPSSFDNARWDTEAGWKTALARSDVRLQWDPDHGPTGGKLERRAVQLGLRGDALRPFSREWLVAVEDITPRVREQHAHVLARRWDELQTPRERIYPVHLEIDRILGMDKTPVKINFVFGDATNPPIEARPAVIVHIVNNAGKWGKGFVIAVSARWPEAETAYHDWTAIRDGEADVPFALGAVQFVAVGPGVTVANLVGQHGTARRGGKPPIRYEAVRGGLQTVRRWAQENGASVHMPRIGCGLAGGDWQTVGRIVEEELASAGIPVTVYDLPDAPQKMRKTKRENETNDD